MQLGSCRAVQVLLRVDADVPLLLLIAFTHIGVDTGSTFLITFELFAVSEVLLYNTCLCGFLFFFFF